jgi:hypothetical protein
LFYDDRFHASTYYPGDLPGHHHRIGKHCTPPSVISCGSRSRFLGTSST